MKATGIIVEYNPFHNGHLYHAQQAKKTTKADCVIAVMSGSFLQRGEPAIVDKFARTKMALANGVDIVVELPYPFAVQSSQYFAAGSVDTLAHLLVDSICFGSESGEIAQFKQHIDFMQAHEKTYNHLLRENLDKGMAFPNAHDQAIQKIHLHTKQKALNLQLPNNILGIGYVDRIMKYHKQIQPVTIKRKASAYHDEQITGPIASATSIRKNILESHQWNSHTKRTVPEQTVAELNAYYAQTKQLHSLDLYYHFLRFIILRENHNTLRMIHGVDEGLEYRLKATARTATSMTNWMNQIKSKRYTWTRLQRMFIHILTNTTKSEIVQLHKKGVEHIRLLGMTKQGQQYINMNKKKFEVPIVTSLQKMPKHLISIEERVIHSYYSILGHSEQNKLFKQELQGPIMSNL